MCFFSKKIYIILAPQALAFDSNSSYLKIL